MRFATSDIGISEAAKIVTCPCSDLVKTTPVLLLAPPAILTASFDVGLKPSDRWAEHGRNVCCSGVTHAMIVHLKSRVPTKKPV